MEDAELKYTELAEVLQVIAARHGAWLLKECLQRRGSKKCNRKYY